MNSLQTELHRLYLPASTPDQPDGAAPALIDAHDRVRALVLELTGPADWRLLAQVWQGVQAELELPAPGIAVSGTDGLQLWFSLAEPIGVGAAQGFLQQLRARFLPELADKRIRLLPAPTASALRQDLHARLVPAPQGDSGNWSAFVASDLAPIFAETPWLDIPPGAEGQASLLSKLRVTSRSAFEAACALLQRAALPAPSHGRSPASPASVPGLADEGPEAFLLRIMNDDTVALAHRIEAAKALLPHAKPPEPPARA